MADHVVVGNIRARVVRLQMAIQTGEYCLDNIRYRLDSLCRDVLQYRDSVPNYETVAANLVVANQHANEVVTDNTHGLTQTRQNNTPETCSTGGRPKFIITEEQLRFFIGRLFLKYL